MWEYILVGTVVLVLVVVYFRKKLFRCPECDFRLDYDHIVEVTDEAPYCPYCGTHTDYVGRKWQAWSAKVRRADLEPVRKAGGER